MPETTCAAPECAKSRHISRSRYCPMHLWRLRKYGSLDLPARQPRGPYVEKTGYIKANGEWLHRTILRAVIGGEPHPCHWCNRMLTWDVDLLVDHVDGDKLNNDPHNLVPACNSCNVGRVRVPVEACKNGHRFTPENTYINPASGSRVCRTCSSAYKAEWQRNKRRMAAQTRRAA